MEPPLVGPLVDSTPAQDPQRVRLDGRRVTLCPIDPATHGPSLYAASHGPNTDGLWRYLGDGPFRDRALFEKALAEKASSRDPLYFAIVDRDSREAIGWTAFLRMDPANRVIEVGSILFTVRLQRTAAATEAMYLMARYVFEDLGYRRYEWKCDALNVPSRRAAERLGFVFEGVFRQHKIVKGRNRDTAWYAMLDGDWPGVKSAFERWLDPSNFDATGAQHRSLLAMRGDVLA